MTTKEYLSVANLRYVRSTLPVLHLPLWKKDGGSFLSEDGHGHVCTKTGTIPTIQGHSFDGTDDYITPPDDAFAALTTFTVAMWFNPTALASGQYLWSTYVDGNNQIHTQIIGGTTAVQLYVIAGGVLGIQWQTAELVAGQNTHLVFTYPAVNGQNARCFQNGVEKTNVVFGARDCSGKSFADLVGTQVNRIGQQANASYFKGIVGEAQLFNRVLPPTEIYKSYQLTQWRYQ